MSYQVIAYIADGSLICQHPECAVETTLQKQLIWQETERQEAGSFFQATWVADVTETEAIVLKAARLENVDVTDDSEATTVL